MGDGDDKEGQRGGNGARIKKAGRTGRKGMLEEASEIK